jgi:hypothetical protein
MARHRLAGLPKHIGSVFTNPWLYVALVLVGISLFIGVTYMSATPGDPEPLSVDVFLPGNEPEAAEAASSPLHAVHVFYIENHGRAQIDLILRSPSSGEAWIDVVHAAHGAVAIDTRCGVRCSQNDGRWAGTDVEGFTVFKVPIVAGRQRELVIPLDRTSFQSTYAAHEIGVRPYNIAADEAMRNDKLIPKSGYQVLDEEWTFDGIRIPGIDEPQFIGGRPDVSDVRLDTRLLSGDPGGLSRLMYVRWTDLRQASRRDFMLFCIAALLGLGGSAFFEVLRRLVERQPH